MIDPDSPLAHLSPLVRLPLLGFQIHNVLSRTLIMQMPSVRISQCGVEGPGYESDVNFAVIQERES